MAKKFKTGSKGGWLAKNWLAVVVIAAIGLTATGLGIWGYTVIQQGLITPQAPAAEFEIEVLNGITLDTLDNDDFNYTLYGTDSLEDWIAFETIEDGSSLDKITNGDLIDYTYFVVRYNGTVLVDNPKVADEDDEISVTFYERWSQIFPNIKNTLYSYQEPTDAGLVVVDTETFELVNITAGIEFPTNTSIIIGSNATEVNAAWVAGPNFENEVDDAPNLVLTFNDTVALSDYSIGGTTKSRYNSTALKFSFNKISASPQTFLGRCDPDTALNVTAIDLYFGDTLIQALA